MAKIGDTVRYLNSTGGGIITRIEGNTAWVDEPDGFETPVLLRECVVVLGKDVKDSVAKEATRYPSQTTKTPALATKSAKKEEKPTQTAGPAQGLLNLTLAYDPREIKHLNTTTFDAYLVNDSPYDLYVAYLTRADREAGWKTRFHGLIEAGMQEWLDEFTGTDLNQMARVAIQYIAFMPQGEFMLKSPVAIEVRLDGPKFFKLHCFRDNPYFDTPVMDIELVKNDVPRRQVFDLSASLQSPEIIEKQKIALDRRKPRPVTKRQDKDEPIVTNLHIDELVDTTAGLSNADMLNLQIDAFRRVMDTNIKNHGQKLIFIHGKGEGVLRAALMKELTHRYKGHEVQDASFREYGFGATQVTIK